MPSLPSWGEPSPVPDKRLRRMARRHHLESLYPERRVRKYMQAFGFPLRHPSPQNKRPPKNNPLQLELSYYPPRLYRQVYVAKHGPRWIAHKKSEEEWHHLDNFFARLHLGGDTTLAAQWRLDLETRVAVVDIDNHDGKSKADLIAILRKVRWVLPWSLVFRSSTSGGLHVYVWFDDYYPAETVRERLVEGLSRVVPVEPGIVEVWPANTALRLPLGQGSCLLDPDTLEPVYARYDRAGRLRRAPALDIKAAHDFASSQAINRPQLYAIGKKISTYSTPKPKKRLEIGGSDLDIPPPITMPRANSGQLRGADFWAEFAAAKQGARTGHRYDDHRRLLFGWYIPMGLSREETLSRHTEWLETAHHTSRDLTGRRRAGTIRSMERDAIKYLDDHLDKGIESEDLTKRKPTRQVDRHTDTYLAEMVEIAQRTAGRLARPRPWRKYARSYASSADRVLVDGLDRPLAQRITLLLGLLRLTVEKKKTTIRIVSINSKAVNAMIGGTRARGRGPELIAHLVGLGVLTLHAEEIVGERCRTYAVRLPE